MSKRFSQSNRCFVAVRVPALWGTAVVELCGRLERSGLFRNVRWSECEKLHVTLCFLGSVASAEMTRLTNDLGELCSQTRAFSICGSGSGLFPDKRSPKVLWVSIVEPSGVLERLAQSVGDVCFRNSNAMDPRSFRAHLTIGRCSSPIDPLGVARFSKETERFNLADSQVESVSLFRSELGPKGSRYTELKCFPLKI